jgi:hypothetical protein
MRATRTTKPDRMYDENDESDEDDEYSSEGDLS